MKKKDKGHIPKEKFHAIFVRSEDTDRLINEVFHQTKRLIIEERKKENDRN